jgi:hypothetical protein
MDSEARGFMRDKQIDVLVECAYRSLPNVNR